MWPDSISYLLFVNLSLQQFMELIAVLVLEFITAVVFIITSILFSHVVGKRSRVRTLLLHLLADIVFN
jgi:hypothetical protein